MPPSNQNNSQHNSFIPKRGPSAKTRTTKKQSSPWISVIISIIFGATVIASLALLGYEWYLNNQLRSTTVELGRAAESFSEADLSRVLEFDRRLNAAQELFSQHISVNRALTELARSTVSTVNFSSVSLEREDRSILSVVAQANTDDIGSVLAQRSTYQSNEVFSRVSLDDLSLAFVDPTAETEAAGDDTASEDPVSVVVTLDLPVDVIAHELTTSSQTENQGTPISFDTVDTDDAESSGIGTAVDPSDETTAQENNLNI